LDSAVFVDFRSVDVTVRVGSHVVQDIKLTWSIADAIAERTQDLE
jgi:hypothetical protein